MSSTWEGEIKTYTLPITRRRSSFTTLMDYHQHSLSTLSTHSPSLLQPQLSHSSIHCHSINKIVPPSSFLRHREKLTLFKSEIALKQVLAAAIFFKRLMPVPNSLYIACSEQNKVFSSASILLCKANKIMFKASLKQFLEKPHLIFKKRMAVTSNQ